MAQRLRRLAATQFDIRQERAQADDQIRLFNSLADGVGLTAPPYTPM